MLGASKAYDEIKRFYVGEVVDDDNNKIRIDSRNENQRTQKEKERRCAISKPK